MKTIITTAVTTLATLGFYQTGWALDNSPEVIAGISGDAASSAISRQDSDDARLLSELKIELDRGRKDMQLAQAELKKTPEVRPFPGAPKPPAPPEMIDEPFEWNVAEGGGGGAFAQLGADIRALVNRPGRALLHPLIVQHSTDDPARAAHLEEDLAVMSRILNKAADPEAGRAAHNWAMGIVVTTLGAPQAPQTLYLDGYGALFLLSVKHPLVAPEAEEPVKAPAVEPDSEWETARAEVFGRRGGVAARARTERGRRGASYDAAQVEDLKHRLVDALKSAKNIRSLKDSDWITVVVTGSDGGRGATVRAASPPVHPMPPELAKRYGLVPQTPNVPADKDVMVYTTEAGPSGDSASQMVLRVKREDVDAFASARLTADEFEKRVAITTR